MSSMITIKYVYMIKYIDWKNKTLKNLFIFYQPKYYSKFHDESLLNETYFQNINKWID